MGGHSSSNDNKKVLYAGLGEYTTHAAVLNNYFGFSYKHFQQAYKRLPDLPFAVWFPKIADKKDGGYVSTDTLSGWVNVLSDDGGTIHQIDNGEAMSVDAGYQRIVFSKMPDGFYHFLGVFDHGTRDGQAIRFTRLGKLFDISSMQIVG